MSTTRYPGAMRILHWVMAPLVIGVLVLGLVMENLPQGVRAQGYSLHKSFGVAVLLLILMRLGVRWTSALPVPVAGLQRWERLLARAVHHAFYVLLLAMPVSGIVMSQAGGHPVAFFGLNLPVFVIQDKHLGRFAYESHELIGNALIALVVLHVAGVLKHALVDRMNLLKRMA